MDGAVRAEAYDRGVQVGVMGWKRSEMIGKTAMRGNRTSQRNLWLKRVTHQQADGSTRTLKRLCHATGGDSYMDGNCWFHSGGTPLGCASAFPLLRAPTHLSPLHTRIPVARAQGGESMPRVCKHNTLLHNSTPSPFAKLFKLRCRSAKQLVRNALEVLECQPLPEQKVHIVVDGVNPLNKCGRVAFPDAPDAPDGWGLLV